MEKVRIGDICDILNGYAFKSDEYVEEGIRVVRIANVQKGYIEDNVPVFYPFISQGLEKYMLEEGDLLMSLTGNVGRVAILEKDMLPAALNQRVACLRLKTDIIKKGFLFHILNSDFFEQQCIQASNGVAQKNMSTEWLKNYEIPLYSIKEQLIITKILDGIRNIISLRNKEKIELESLIKARFVELMDSAELGKEKRIEDITERVKVGFVGTCEEFYTDESGVPMLRTGNITERGIELKGMKYVTKEFHEKNKKSQIHEGDLLIARHGSNGQANVYYGPEAQCLNAVVIVPNQDIACSVFLAGLINSPMVKKQIDKTLVGSTQHVLNTKSIASLEVKIPSMIVQKEYVNFAYQVNKSKLPGSILHSYTKDKLHRRGATTWKPISITC